MTTVTAPDWFLYLIMIWGILESLQALTGIILRVQKYLIERQLKRLARTEITNRIKETFKNPQKSEKPQPEKKNQHETRRDLN